MTDMTDTKRMRLLWVAPYVPYPPSHGGKVRVFNILKRLGARHQIHLLAVDDTGMAEASLRPLDAYCARVEVVPQYHPRSLTSRVAQTLSPRPMAVAEATSSAGMAALDRLLSAGPFDAAVIEQVQAAEYIRPLRRAGIPVLLVCHNVERRVWEGLKRYPPTLKKKLRAQLEVSKLRRYEPRVVRAATARVAVSEEDRSELERIARVPVGLSPNGVDTDFFAFQPRTARSQDAPWRLVMTGSMSYLPNVDAAQFFLDAVLPLLRARQRAVEVSFVGSNPTTELLASDDPANGVRFTGFVEDVRPYVAGADIFIAPLRHGSGTRLKLLEAMAQGVPVVTTTAGCEGLDVRHQEHLWIADTPEAFAAGVATLMGDPERGAAMTANARILVERAYSWEPIAAALEAELVRIAHTPTQSGPEQPAWAGKERTKDSDSPSA
jgi:glycosyltransferase involved in cell wall biosynthesis